MSLIFADFPSGQHGLYGRDESLLTSSSVYAQLISKGLSITILADDPDPVIGSTGTVFKTFADATTTAESALRWVLPVPAYTEGVSFRLWLDSLPSNATSTPYFSFRNASNGVIFALRVLSTGSIEIRSAVTNSGTLYGTTTDPVLTSGAWNQIEIKATADPAVGAVEVVVNSISRLSLTGLNLGSNQIAQYQFGSYDITGSAEAPAQYWKDMVYWDTTGTEVNDFIGPVAVYDLHPDGDNNLQWAVSRGSTGFNLIDDNKPSNTLTSSGLISSGNQVRINNTYYNWTSGSVDAGTPAGTSGAPWLVKLGATDAESLENMYNAINATGVAGTTYSTALTAHAQVIADGYDATHIDIESIDGITTSYTCTETGTNLAWAASTMNQRHTDTSYISANDTPPLPSSFTMTNLPEDVTSIKGVFMIGRMYKSDGGDCNIQMALSPNNTNWDSGSNRPVTVAPTIWWDVSELSPATAAAWTPIEVNNLLFRVDRTL